MGYNNATVDNSCFDSTVNAALNAIGFNDSDWHSDKCFWKDDC